MRLIDNNEAEANYFAMHLLMPQCLLEREVASEVFTEQLVERSAKKFVVSETWAVIRLQEYFRGKP